ILFISAILLVLNSCNEDKWLEEVPYSFYSPSNSFNNESDFESAIAYLYSQSSALYSVSTMEGRALHYPSDLAYSAIATNQDLNQYKDKLTPEATETVNLWKKFYQIVFNANVILNRLQLPEAKLSEQYKKATEAEARFFRAFAYRYLTGFYGGVPLVLEETNSAKRNFERASKDQVLRQCVEDLSFAQNNLPEI